MDKRLKFLIAKHKAARSALTCSDAAKRRELRLAAEIWMHITGSSRLPHWSINFDAGEIRDINHNGHKLVIKEEKVGLSTATYRCEIEPPVEGIKEVVVFRMPGGGWEVYNPEWALDMEWIPTEN